MLFRKRKDVPVTSFYKEELLASQDLMSLLSLSGIGVSSVDSSQGSESSVVILSTARQWLGYGLLYLSKMQRSCVALSQAKDFLVVVEDGDMTFLPGVDVVEIIKVFYPCFMPIKDPMGTKLREIKNKLCFGIVMVFYPTRYY